MGGHGKRRKRDYTYRCPNAACLQTFDKWKFCRQHLLLTGHVDTHCMNGLQQRCMISKIDGEQIKKRKPDELEKKGQEEDENDVYEWDEDEDWNNPELIPCEIGDAVGLVSSSREGDAWCAGQQHIDDSVEASSSSHNLPPWRQVRASCRQDATGATRKALDKTQDQDGRKQTISPEPGCSGIQHVRVLWDIENVAVPNKHDAYSVGTTLNKFLEEHGYGGPGVNVLVTVFGRCQEQIKKGLDKAGVLICYTGSKVEEADRRIIDAIDRDLATHPPKLTAFVLVTSDQDFRYKLRDLKSKGYYTVVVHTAQKGSSHAAVLSEHATHAFDWSDVLNIVHKLPQSSQYKQPLQPALGSSSFGNSNKRYASAASKPAETSKVGSKSQKQKDAWDLALAKAAPPVANQKVSVKKSITTLIREINAEGHLPADIRLGKVASQLSQVDEVVALEVLATLWQPGLEIDDPNKYILDQCVQHWSVQ